MQTEVLHEILMAVNGVAVAICCFHNYIEGMK